MPRALMVCRKPRSYWARRRPWKSTTASTTSMPSSSDWTGRWCTPKACRGRNNLPPRSNSPKRSHDLSKYDDFRFFAGLEIIGNQLDGNGPQLRGHSVPDLDHGFLAVDEIQYFVGIDGRAVLHIEKPTRIRMQQLDLAHALRAQSINQHIVILIDQRPELGDARGRARAIARGMPLGNRCAVNSSHRGNALQPIMQRRRLFLQCLEKGRQFFGALREGAKGLQGGLLAAQHLRNEIVRLERGVLRLQAQILRHSERAFEALRQALLCPGRQER